jgi:hypothetical protein
MDGSHPEVPYTQFEPNQNPRAYEASMAKKRAPMPAPEMIAYFVAFFVTSSKHLSYLISSKCSPFNCLTVLIEDKAC